ncbi:MAG: MMPL family transporter [Treponema sp.]|nr:MMPL family transporter [Treponema sp.]
MVITVFFALSLTRVELDNNNLRFVPSDDPALSVSRHIDEMFGSSLFILVGLERENGTVFDGDFLNRIRVYVDEVKKISIVREVVSIISADYITLTDGAIVVETLVRDDFSGTPQEIAELKRRLLSWDLYDHAMVSDDFTATQILIPLSISQEEASLPTVSGEFLFIRDLAREMFDGLCNVYVTGMPVIVATINEEMTADLKLLIPLVVIVVMAILLISYRKFTGLVLPMVAVVVAVVWAMGAIPLFGFKLSVISTVLPVILVATGNAYTIHIVTHYLTDRGKTKMNWEEHKLYVLKALRKILKPVSLTAVTTIAGFFSLCFTVVPPIKEFGYFACFGIFASYVASVTLIPSLLIIKGPEKKNSEKKGSETTLIADSLMFMAGKRKTIIFLVVCVIAASIIGTTKVTSDNAMIEYFKPDTDVAKSDKFIRDNFGGSKIVNVVLQSESYEMTLHPATLTALDSLGSRLERMSDVGKVMGFTDMIKRINQILNAQSDPAGRQRTEEPSDFDDFGFGFDSWGFDDVYTETIENKTPSEETYFSETEFFTLLETASGEPLVISASDLVKEVKRRLNYEGSAYYEVPADPSRYGMDTPEDLQRLVSNYLVLLSGGISNYANDPLEPSAIKSTVQLRTMGMEDTQIIVDEIYRYLSEHAPPNVNVTVGGSTLVEGSINTLIVQSQLTSILISLICVFIIVSAFNRSWVAGLISILPLSISVLVNFAVMGFVGIKLNLGTAMMAAVSIAVGIDFAIHYIEAAKREYKGGEGDFLRRGFLSSGKAIVIDAVSNGAGFAVLLFSRFNMLVDFGLLVAITMFTSALVSLTVLPALIGLIKPKFITGGVK